MKNRILVLTGVAVIVVFWAGVAIWWFARKGPELTEVEGEYQSYATQGLFPGSRQGVEPALLSGSDIYLLKFRGRTEFADEMLAEPERKNLYDRVEVVDRKTVYLQRGRKYRAAGVMEDLPPGQKPDARRFHRLEVRRIAVVRTTVVP